MSLRRINSGSRVAFQWQNDYDFVWSETGISPSNVFDAKQILSANPPYQNTVTFARINSGHNFTQAVGGQFNNLLTIKAEDVLFEEGAGSPSIGIANSGAPLFARPARPHTIYNFLIPPQQQYRIAHGSYEQGQVLDIDAITDFVELIFLRDQFNMTVTLNADMSWTVKPG
ncbi:hypothetical protein [Pedobacter sp. KACC 23697]|uniref:Uncharacterized protein n=1 Tax=Pedobacter sp. KACC 23697 TaxID=3149230 RepID=A0AAU7K165_9SPHI